MNIETLRSTAEAARERVATAFSRASLQARDEGRELTPTEQASINTLMKEAKHAAARLNTALSDVAMSGAIDAVTGGAGTTDAPAVWMPRGTGRSGGAQFTAATSPAWTHLRNTRGTRAGNLQTPATEIATPAFYGAVLDTSGGSGTAGALIVPDYQGLVPYPPRPTAVRDLIAPGSTTSGMVTFTRRKSFTNAAAPVGEAGLKPESAVVYEQASSKVEKIAHWIPATNEVLDDVPQMQSAIDGELREGINLVEEDQLLNGDGVSPNLLGFLNLPGLAAPIAKGASENNWDGIARQIAAIATATNMTPTGVVVHPSNWLSAQLLKTTDGHYLSGSSPLAAPLPRALWGLPVALSLAIPLGTALVGAFSSASQLFDRGGTLIDVSNSHADFFIKNLVAIRAERRLALVVRREEAFGVVTGLV